MNCFVFQLLLTGTDAILITCVLCFQDTSGDDEETDADDQESSGGETDDTGDADQESSAGETDDNGASDEESSDGEVEEIERELLKKLLSRRLH